MSESTVISLDSGLSIVEAAQQRDRLLQALAGAGGDLVLDLTAISECDSAGVQLLLAAARTLRERGHHLQLRQPPEAVCQALASYGLDETMAPLSPAAAGECA
jgi:phospholipid transport system transporter-binding protein